MLQGKNAANEAVDRCVCEPDAMVPKANNRRYVSSADPPSDSLHKNLAWWMVGSYTFEKPETCQNWEVGASLGMGARLGQYGT